MPCSAKPIPKRVCAVDGTVVAHEMICREHVAITLEFRTFPSSAPGQFLLLQCHDAAQSRARPAAQQSSAARTESRVRTSARVPYLRRPFSIADRVDAESGVRLLVLSRNVGPGTAWLEQLRVGDLVNVTGPLGNGFRFPEREKPIILCGGGVGIPPLLYASDILAQRGCPHVTLVVGAMSADLLPVTVTGTPASDGQPTNCAELPGGEQRDVVVTTDDGTLGHKGRVTDALDRLLAAPEFAGAQVLACGPEPMLAAVARLTRRLGVGCQVCLERFMACGLGTCLSCVVRTVRPESPSWVYSQACQDGPVYDRDAVVDYQ